MARAEPAGPAGEPAAATTARITTYSHPLESNPTFLVLAWEFFPLDQLAAVLMVVGLSVAPAHAMSVVILERASGAKHMQWSSGCGVEVHPATAPYMQYCTLATAL